MTQRLTIQQIKQALVLVEDLSDPLLQALTQDSRKGVQRILQQRIRQIENHQVLKAAYLERLHYESAILADNPQAIIGGVDEVGRGPIAGPVVAACVVLPQDTSHWYQVNDSKSLSHDKRLELAQMIQKEARAYQIVEVSESVIDEINIYQASRQAMKQAVLSLPLDLDHILLDAMTLDLPTTQTSLIKGDQKSLSIAAASIIAKVYRDQKMVELAAKYPEFGFDQHMGYPTKQHIQALQTYGKTPHHRQSFGPVMKVDHWYH